MGLRHHQSLADSHSQPVGARVARRRPAHGSRDLAARPDTASALWQNDVDRLVFSLGAATSQFDTAAVFPDDGRPFPDELWNLRLGANYIRNFANGWTGGLGVNVFSASDEPLAERRDVKVGATAFLRIPVNDRDAWNLALLYSPLSDLPYPLPGIAYQWEPSDDFRMNIGLPFRVMYRPHEALSFDLSYMVLRSIHAQATYRITESCARTSRSIGRARPGSCTTAPTTRSDYSITTSG